jgi:hypothetical protein
MRHHPPQKNLSFLNWAVCLPVFCCEERHYHCLPWLFDVQISLKKIIQKKVVFLLTRDAKMQRSMKNCLLTVYSHPSESVGDLV